MIFCQRCKKANPNDVDYCQECGTYLLVISRPYNAGGFEVGDSLEEHLLERVSALESALNRANERFRAVAGFGAATGDRKFLRSYDVRSA
jgi:hypothetical protein